ncbi:MAG TPA: hypothetical protein IAA63_02800 [Candidatus Pullilachnospira stercoravium]|uniref:Uncharacterized protein n=1 Tax=Candidatus Pullilachnospira stercoravium TaxID=2840913 RepID=A0A9D1NU04_9FIRM|nr:hypothetical protein [Candidatus Pullilachnospira stercoravium]
MADVPLFMETCDEDDAAAMRELLEEYRDCRPDVVIGSGCHGAFVKKEREILGEIFPDTPVTGRVKEIAGETLGSGFSVNTAAAAVCLKQGYVPEALLGKEYGSRRAARILVCGYDMEGNYLCALLVR